MEQDSLIRQHYYLREDDKIDDNQFTIHLFAGRDNIPTTLEIEDFSAGKKWYCSLIKVIRQKATKDRLEMYRCTYRINQLIWSGVNLT